jgi:hypothetical protein
MFGGYQSPEAGAPRAAFSLSGAVGFGYSLEGITTSGGDGKLFATFGIETQAAQYDAFCSGASCQDERSQGSVVPRVPARIGYQIRLRMPFWLVPGDLLLAAPFLAFISPKDLAKMGIIAVDGGLIPWQRVLPTAIGDFQFVVGREAAVTLFNMKRSDPFFAYGGTDPSGQPIYEPIRVKSLRIEVPILEYRPYRSFSEKLGASFVAQLGAGLEVPLVVEPEHPGTPTPNLGDVGIAYLRIFFDGRAYL